MRPSIPKEDKYRELLKGRGLSKEIIEKAIELCVEYIEFLESNSVSLEESSVDDVKKYVKNLMDSGRNTLDRIDAVCMYTNILGYLDQYLYLAQMVGGAPLYQSYLNRTKEIAGEEAAERVFGSIQLPPVGSTAEEFPEYTHAMMKQMTKELSKEDRIKILAGNHHNRSPQSFEAKRRLYKESKTLDEFLKRDHERVVELLEQHMREGRLWYRKMVTQEFLDFIKSDQERLSARRIGDKLYIKQIPYEFEEYQTETNPKKKRYHFCHCHLARKSILEDTPVPSEFCHCSGGYLKQPYDYIFGHELEVEVLQSAMAGDTECRFAVKLPEKWREK
jgi:hypothetical protein